MIDTVVYARGQIYWRSSPNKVDQNIQAKCRPVLIMSNNVGNHFSGIVTVVPLTTQSSHNHLPTHIKIDLPNTTSYLMAEQLTTINKKSLGDYIATVTPEKMIEVDEAVQIALGFKSIDSAEYVNKDENCKVIDVNLGKNSNSPFTYSIVDKVGESVFNDIKNISATKDITDSEIVNDQKSPVMKRHRYTEEEKLQFVLDYDQVINKYMTKEAFLSKYKLTVWGSAQSMNHRFKKQLEV